MTGNETTARLPSLVAIITRRLALASVLALTVQMVIVGFSTRDEEEVARDYIYREARLLSAGVGTGPGGLKFHLPANASHYTGGKKDAYAYRILDAGGHMVAEQNAAIIEQHSPWSKDRKPGPDTWTAPLAGDWLSMSGGERMSVRGDDFYVEVATTGDPAGARWRSYVYEIYEDVLSPMVPLALLLLGVAVLTVRWSMRPLADAARKAESITALDRPERFDLAGLPQEAASFALAINRLLERVGALIESQRLFIARAAHELRTPLAIMLLELGKIGDDRARRLESDVTAMAQSVARLLTLAKLKALHEPQRDRIDLIALAEEVVSHMKAWAAERGHDLSLITPETSGEIMADRTAIREALRNLIENAVTHTPIGTRVDVTLTPSLEIIVEDNGPGLGDAELTELMQPFEKGVASSEGSGLGLAIVAQAVELHGGSLEYAKSERGGARFVMKLGPLPSQ